MDRTTLGLTPLEVYCLSAVVVDGATVGTVAQWRGVNHTSISRAVQRAMRKLQSRRHTLALTEGTGTMARRRALPADY